MIIIKRLLLIFRSLRINLHNIRQYFILRSAFIPIELYRLECKNFSNYTNWWTLFKLFLLISNQDGLSQYLLNLLEQKKILASIFNILVAAPYAHCKYNNRESFFLLCASLAYEFISNFVNLPPDAFCGSAPISNMDRTNPLCQWIHNI